MSDEHAELSKVETVMSATKDKMEAITEDQAGIALGPLAVVVAKTIASHAAAIAVMADLMGQPGPRDHLRVLAITDALRKSQEELQAALDAIKSGKFPGGEKKA